MVMELKGDTPAELLHFLQEVFKEFDDCLDSLDCPAERFFYRMPEKPYDNSLFWDSIPRLRGLIAKYNLPISPDALVYFCDHVYERDENGYYNPRLQRELRQTLTGEIEALAVFLELSREDPSTKMVTPRQVAEFIGIELKSLNKDAWPDPLVKQRGSRPAKFDRNSLRPVLKLQYPEFNWDNF